MAYLLSRFNLCRDYCHILLAPAVALPAFNVIEQPMMKIANRNQIVLYILLSPLLGIAQVVNAMRRLKAYNAQAIVMVKALLSYFRPYCGVDVFVVSHNLALPYPTASSRASPSLTTPDQASPHHTAKTTKGGDLGAWQHAHNRRLAFCVSQVTALKR